MEKDLRRVIWGHMRQNDMWDILLTEINHNGSDILEEGIVTYKTEGSDILLKEGLVILGNMSVLKEDKAV